MRKLFASLAILLTVSGTTFANSYEDPSKYLEGLASNMIEAVEQNKEALKKDQVLAANLVKKHLLPAIDTQYFSKKTLGSKTWKSMSESQQKSFEQGYIEQVISKYAKGLSFYDGQAFTFNPAKISKRTGNALVKSQMKQSGSKPFKVDYVLSKSTDKWLITNIYVEGTNMRKSYKNQFAPRIKEIGIEKFIEELNQPKVITKK